MWKEETFTYALLVVLSSDLPFGLFIFSVTPFGIFFVVVVVVVKVLRTDYGYLCTYVSIFLDFCRSDGPIGSL